MAYDDRLTLTELSRLVKNDPSYALLRKLGQDDRKGALKLYNQLERKLTAIEQERERLAQMYQTQEVLCGEPQVIAAGVDEAGRGPLAGPVIASAVVLPADEWILGLNDSKALAPREREKIYEQITAKAISIGIGRCDPRKIDEVNIHKATFFSMEAALTGLDCDYESVLFDGRQVPPSYQTKGQAVVKGDKKVACIAAAGIIAKVTRDKIMNELHNNYPEYCFYNNKGYATRDHINALEKYGPSPWHRHSFLRDEWMNGKTINNELS